MFFRNDLLQITSSVLLLIFTLQKENSAAFEGLQSMLYPFLMFTSLWMSHCFVTSVFKCADVISPGILHRVRHATIIWDDQHISHKRSSKEERLTYMHNFLFSSCSPAFCQCQQRKLLSFYSSQLPYHHCFAASGVFVNTWWSVPSYVLLGLKVHPLANTLDCSITPHWLISDTLVTDIHQSCCIRLGFSKSDFVEWKRLYQIYFLWDFIFQSNSVIYYFCWARMLCYWTPLLQTTGTFISGNNLWPSYIHIFSLLNTFQI